MVNHPNRKPRASRTAAAVVSTQCEHDHDRDYSALLDAVHICFNVTTQLSTYGHLFTTDAAGLWEIYLGAMGSERQVHDCHACRHFVERFGGMVAIDATGRLHPAMWDAPGIAEFYQPAFNALTTAVASARVTGQFLSSVGVLGTPKTGAWTHMSASIPYEFLYSGKVLTAGQAMAAVKENYRTVVTALGEFKPAMLDEAIRIMKADALSRSERFIAPLRWLRDLHDRPNGRSGENVLWRAIGAAPEGYCHPRASVTGSLLEDIAAGLEFEDIKRKFEAKVHPLQYQRPQAAPSSGNIAAAEAIVAKMGIRPSFERRFARLDEVEAIWKPKPAAEKPTSTDGMFGHLKTKDQVSAPQVDLPTVTMTWDKFARTILPDAERIELEVPSHGNFMALVTAEHADAPPILKWDREDRRNPVSWYVYDNGSPAIQWRLAGNAWAPVSAAVLPPPMWGDKPMPHLGSGVLLVLDGAADTRIGQGIALFPENMREELHAVRSVVEAYSKSAELGGRDEASACGLHFGKGSIDHSIRVQSRGSWSSYRIDRWD